MTKQTIKRLIDFIGFVAVIGAAILVLLAKLIPSASNIILLIAGIICFFVCVLSGTYYALTKRNGVYIALVCIAVIGAVVAFILL